MDIAMSIHIGATIKILHQKGEQRFVAFAVGSGFGRNSKVNPNAVVLGSPREVADVTRGRGARKLTVVFSGPWTNGCCFQFAGGIWVGPETRDCGE